MALPLFATTLFVSAFILFLVQPMIGKLILPKLGGTPQVWNTCMVFFQMVLLAGYAYTHFVSSRLRLKQQLLLHAVLLFLPLAVLLPTPFNIKNWVPELGVNPIPSTLWILTIVVGLPFLVVSTSAPLLQKWFVHTGHPAAKDPYFLYGASNLGSMLALLCYPFLIEPTTAIVTQTWIWTIGYGLLIVLVLACVAMVWAPALMPQFAGAGHPEETTTPDAPAPAAAAESSTAVAAGTPQAPKMTGIKKGPRPQGRGATGRIETPAETASIQRAAEEVTPWRRVRWVLLAAVPSSLMLGITTHITTDLSPIPLFWLIPLTLYLLSFILVFARWPVVWTEEPHKIMLYGQPVAIGVMLLIDFLAIAHSYIWMAVFFNVLGFFFTVMVCHGELAKDRPSTRYLTEFYLWMSVGGMVGGMFNALIAPVIFKTLIELGVAIFVAGLIRPVMRESGWLDDLIAGVLEPAPDAPAVGPKGARGARPQTIARATSTASPSMSYSLDVILGLLVLILTLALAFTLDPNPNSRNYYSVMMTIFGIPLLIAAVFYARPLRFGLAIGGVMLAHAGYVMSKDSSEFTDRSFFGIISVKKSANPDARIAGEKVGTVEFRQLIHGHINHGMNFIKPKDEKEWGNPQKNLSRLATTYYHRLGPAGRVMELYNWFPSTPENQYWADARMPASLVGQLAGGLGIDPLPYNAFVDVWSEPPFATVGLGTGTMASYGRPFQHVHYYEIDNQIKRLSLPEKGSGDPVYFTYLKEALSRGCDVQVFMGDARLRMDLPYQSFHEQQKLDGPPGGGPHEFYHMMVVDAFSSDAIPAHLITREGIKMYFEHLVEEGILCVHTSNRFVDLPKVVAAVAADLKLVCLRAHDNSPFDKTGHFTSEWVMVARKTEYLAKLKDLEPEGYQEASRRKQPNARAEDLQYWNIPVADSRFRWTDDYYNLMSVIR